MPDRRDFWLVFLCATSGITGWLCFDRYRLERYGLDRYGGAAVPGAVSADASLHLLRDLYDPVARDAALACLGAGTESIDLPTSEAVAGVMLEGVPASDCTVVATAVLMRSAALGPLGALAVRGVLAGDDEQQLDAALDLLARSDRERAQRLAPDLGALVADRGRANSRGRELARRAAALLAGLGGSGLRELVALATADDPSVRHIARTALAGHVGGR
jgi:hypothetical protein